MRKETHYYVLGAGLIFMICICSLMLGMTHKQRHMLETQLHDHTSALFDLIVITRRWNSGYGGVFVKKGHGVVSNPYLVNPDIVDTNGTVYTKKNPALMTKEISYLAKSEESFTFHITSLKLRNTGNAPDAWEKTALDEFERGEVEKTGSVKKDGTIFYRFMKPLYVEESCLACHSDQDYRVGEVRGGISVDVPFTATLRAIRKNSIIMICLLVSLLLVFAVTLYLFIWKVMDRLVKQRFQLEQLNQTKNKFLGIAAHDLRNPLTSIGGFSEILMNDELGPVSADQKEFLRIIHSTSEEMLAIVNDLLDVSVIESGKLELKYQKGSINSLIEDRIKINKVIADKQNITLLSDLTEIPEFMFDPKRIAQVTDNLISNAIKFSPHNLNIYVISEMDNNKVRVSVRDEGPGISKEDQSRLFGEFQRLTAQPTDGQKSTGLGLSIVKKIVEAHGGTTSVVSELGEGATFSFVLPLEQSDGK